MTLELLAAVDPNNPAYKAGFMVGIAIAVIISASIPIAVGKARNQVALGAIGAVFAGIMGFLFGLVGGLPTAGVFSLIIVVAGAPQSTRRRRRRSDDDDDYEFDR
jgi:hypothetical protein